MVRKTRKRKVRNRTTGRLRRAAGNRRAARSARRGSVVRDRTRRLAVIVPACDESETIGPLLDQLQRLTPDELIVVVNGSSDETAQIALRHKARVLEYPYRLGNDVGRAIGALYCDADVYLFTDADFVLEAEQFQALVRAVEAGADVALNSLRWLEHTSRPDVPTLDRYFLNLALKRRDLGLENLLTIPHALSRKAVQVIGRSTLASPLLATAVALDSSLVVECPTAVNVLAKNRRRPTHKRQPGESMSQATQRIHGDALEAVRYLLDKYGRRAGYGSGCRKRRHFALHKWSGGEVPTHSAAEVSVVLSVFRRGPELEVLVSELTRGGAEVVLVGYGGSGLVTSAAHGSIKVIALDEQVGHDVALAIGATVATGDILVFHDTSVPVSADELFHFARAVDDEGVDVALNDQGSYAGPLADMHPVHIGNWFVNTTIGQRHLATSSLSIPPYAMRREALQKLTPPILMSPYLALVRAVECGLEPRAVRFVNCLDGVDEESRDWLFDPERALGDCFEALDYWTARHGYRGGFTDEGRRRDLLVGASGVYQTKPPVTRSEDEIDLTWLLEWDQRSLDAGGTARRLPNSQTIGTPELFS